MEVRSTQPPLVIISTCAVGTPLAQCCRRLVLARHAATLDLLNHITSLYQPALAASRAVSQRVGPQGIGLC